MTDDVERAPDQDAVIEALRERVDAWRGFALDRACDPTPDPGRYEPVQEGELSVTDTTMTLLQHWFRPGAHELKGVQGIEYFKYWPHQRRAVETFIYLREVLRLRRAEDLWRVAGFEVEWKQRDPWNKLGAQLATGSGKTKVMSLLAAWSYLNAVCEAGNPLGLGRHVLIVAPVLFVRDRLLQDFLPPDDAARSVFALDPVIPRSLESEWHVTVYSPTTCPRRLDPSQGALVVTNYHQLMRRVSASVPVGAGGKRQPSLSLFEEGEPAKLESVDVPLIERFSRSRGLLVINDEAHHVWDEPGHLAFEEKRKTDPSFKVDQDTERAMAWIDALRRLHGASNDSGKLGLQIDLSATLFEETGAVRKVVKGQKEQVKFRARSLFRHTAVRFDLSEAIQHTIVKRPVLERVKVTNKVTGAPEPLVFEGAPNAWEKYRNLMGTGIQRWRELRDNIRAEGGRKPIMFVLCEDKSAAAEITNFLRYGVVSKEDLDGYLLTGYKDPGTGETLFVEQGADGVKRSTVIEVHIGAKEASSEKDWEKVRALVNLIDRPEIPDPSGICDDFGRPVMVSNPYNVVVSVMMLKEGWDVRGVQVIVPLRQCNSRTLTEQVLGRGLRKVHPPGIDESGAAVLLEERLFVIEHPSFEEVIDEIRDLVDVQDSDKITHRPEYVAVTQREGASECDVRMASYEGYYEVVRDWHDDFDANALKELKPRKAWQTALNETDVETFLKVALRAGEELGMQFTLSDSPSYTDFDHVIEAVYVIPLLKSLHKSYTHKTAVKAVVRRYLQSRTFDLPVAISFESAIEAGLESARIAMANLSRHDVSRAVIDALVEPLRQAMSRRLPSREPRASERLASKVAPYQAIKDNVLSDPKRSVFTCAALANKDELRVAALLDRAEDVLGWINNHIKVGYSIEYEWMKRTAKYVPDFIVRARIGKVEHNVIIEVKGRLDDKDKVKARRGVEYARLLTEADKTPWHYLFLIENPSLKRADITWWGSQSITQIQQLLRRHELLALVPDTDGATSELLLSNAVPKEDEYVRAVPVLDLVAKGGGFSDSQTPVVRGWLSVPNVVGLDRQCFVAQMQGASMQTPVGDGVPDGAWVLFRRYEQVPPVTALDGRRLLVELREASDPDGGGQYSVKRLRVVDVDAAGAAERVELRSDNPTFQPIAWSSSTGELRVIAEVLRVLS